MARRLRVPHRARRRAIRHRRSARHGRDPARRLHAGAARVRGPPRRLATPRMMIAHYLLIAVRQLGRHRFGPLSSSGTSDGIVLGARRRQRRIEKGRTRPMCDEHYVEDLERYLNKANVTRRKFGALSASVGLSMLLPPVANAQQVTEKDVEIRTPDGVCDAYFVHPSSGAHAAVLVWPDILGLRPAFRQMGKRLAESGYSVLTVNPFYRQKRSPVVPDGATFADPAVSAAVRPLAAALNATTHVTDARAFIAWLDAQPQVDKNRKIGTTGYCMGGPI